MDELNQTQEFDALADENLFTEEPTSETVNEEQGTEVQETETPAQEETQEATATPEPFITIRYNKEDKPLTKEEAIQYSQMGMNYSKVKSAYDAQTAKLQALASQNGMKVDEYIDKMSELNKAVLLANEVKTLKAQYPNADNKLIGELARKNIDERTQQNQNYERTRKNSYRDNLRTQLDHFQEIYPNVNAGNLDQKVYDLMDSGYSLIEAYQSVEREGMLNQIEALKKQAGIAQTNEANKGKSYGNTQNTGKVEKDEFWDIYSKF